MDSLNLPIYAVPTLVFAIGAILVLSGLFRKPPVQKADLETGELIDVPGTSGQGVFGALLADISKRVRPEDEDLETRLLKSGYVYKTAAEFHARRMYGALLLVGFVVVLFGVLMHMNVFTTAVLASGGAVLGFMQADMSVNRAIKNRREQIRREMSFAVERLSITLNAGQDLQTALYELSGMGLFGGVCEDLSKAMQTNQDMELAAKRSLERLPDTPELREFLDLTVTAYHRSMEDLISMAKSMAVTMRERFANEIKDITGGVKTTVTLLMSGFIVVASIIAAGGPMLYYVMQNF